MSKLANILRMLKMLEYGRIIKIKEISKKLEVKERMIRRYKDVLEQAGIYVESIKGRDGGYILNDPTFNIRFPLSDEDINILITSIIHLKSDESFLYKTEYENIISKINNTYDKDKTEFAQNILFINEAKNLDDVEKNKKMFCDIMSAIKNKKKMEIEYVSLTSGENTRIIHPYEVFVYKGFWYIFAYCELKNEMRQFRLSRVKKYKLLKENFIKKESYEQEMTMKNSIGIFNNGNEINVKLKIKHPMSIIISEKQWVEGQKITYIKEDKSVIFEATMKGLPEIISWVLSMGNNATVLEPEELKREIRKELAAMIEQYNK